MPFSSADSMTTQGLIGNIRHGAEPVAAALKPFHRHADAHQWAPAFLTMSTRPPAGVAIGHEIVDDENTVILAEPLLGDTNSVTFFLYV